MKKLLLAFAACAAMCGASAASQNGSTGSVTYRAGLMQGRFDANYATGGFDDSQDQKHVLDAEFARKGPGANTTYVYVGQMYMDATKTYNVGVKYDDGGFVTFDGGVQKKFDKWNNILSYTYTPTFTGWHDLDLRICNGGGGQGPMTGGNDGGKIVGFSDAHIGFAWNDVGMVADKDNEASNDWLAFADSGDMTKFRVRSDEKIVNMLPLTKDDSGRVVLNFGFPALASPAEISVYCGPTDGGTDPSRWTTTIASGVVLASGAVDYSVALPEGVVLSKENGFVGVHLLTTGNAGLDAFETWTTYDPSGETQASFRVDVVNYYDVDCTISLDSAPYFDLPMTATLQVSTDGAFGEGTTVSYDPIDFVTCPLAVQTKAGGLQPQVHYYLRVKFVSAASEFYSETIEVTTLDDSGIDFADLVSGTQYAVGGAIELRKPTSVMRYVSSNPSVIKVADGHVLKLVSAGVAYVRFENKGVTTDKYLVVLPDPIGSGAVYVRTISGSCSWADTAAWVNVATGETGAYPNGPEDIAFVISTVASPRFAVPAGETKVAELYLAQVGNGNWFELTAADATAVLRFVGTEDRPALFKISGGSFQTGSVTTQIGRNNSGETSFKLTMDGTLHLDLSAPRDVLTDATGSRKSYIVGFQCVNLDVPKNCELRFTHGLRNSDHTKDNGDHFSFTDSRCTLTGQGVLANDSTASIVFGDMRTSAFAGTFVSTASSYPDSPNLSIKAPPPGASAEISGTMGNTTSGGATSGGRMHFNWSGAFTDNPGCSLSPKNITFNGGDIVLPAEDKTWPSDLIARYDFGTTTLKGGDSELYCPPGYGSTRVRNHVTMNVVEGRGTLKLRACANGDEGYEKCTSADCSWVTIENFDDIAIGGNGVPKKSSSAVDDNFKIVPFMVSTANRTAMDIASPEWAPRFTFVAAKPETHEMVVFNESNYAQIPKAGNSNEWKAKAADANVLLNGDFDLTVADDKTVNSLTVGFAKQKGFGSEKSLTITSGGLIMWPNTALGKPNDAGNGTLVFGRTAYVFVNAPLPYNNNGNNLAVPMVAPDDFVKSGYGILSVQGDQTGIDGTIYVNGGLLLLGTDDDYSKYGKAGVATDADFFVHGGATLSVRSDLSATQPAISRQATVTLEDSGAAIAVLELAVNQTCGKLLISGRNKGKALKRGTYGATGSGADYIDDVHFAGTGVLTVRKDDAAGMYLIIR